MPELELGPEKGADLPGLHSQQEAGQARPQNQHSGKPRLSAQMRMAKPRAPHCPHAASVRSGDLIRAHTRISQKLLPSDPRPSGGTARVPGPGLAEDLGGFPSLRTSWPPALLGGQSRSQHLARPPGKVAKERELQGLLALRGVLSWEGPVQQHFQGQPKSSRVERLLWQPGRWAGEGEEGTWRGKHHAPSQHS